ncbi:amino acid adenylation domain-containing protein (plasmid) [Nostoc sp. UHCC 0926]|uniref:non-ribosomal peptide synthetase n=1 Tax=Nostoc sp. UHCC 0926 TaxID=3025190 RepID=UPI00236294A0|nr:non-ribosomal peptide synthetase [Nostoc sp. UHCC 0926]WDD36951.1 amino acid adenylation domain-containing protein [Nostoc sp. UHCC 0926]
MIIDTTINGFRLSPHQKRLWLLQEDSSAYLTQGTVLIQGNLQLEFLKAALQQVVKRHEILRTNLCRLPSVKTPVMVVVNSSPPLWQDIDLSDSPEQKQLSKIEELFQEARHLNFDLEQGSVLRLSLLKLSLNSYVLLVSLPALYADSRTINNLVNEISHLYSNCLQGKELCDEVVQYLQFSEWQNQLLKDENAEAANKYWQDQKLPSQARLRLPFESQPSKQSEFQADCFRLAIAPELTAKISILAQKYNTSTAVILLACWQTLIWRLTRQPDIVIGMAAARRDYEELHNLLGLVATWLPIKSHLTPDLRFKELLELAEQTIEAGSEWQDYFVPEPVENNNPLAFPIGFEFEQVPEELVAAGVSFYIDKYYSCIELFKVKLTCTQRDNLLTSEFYYDVNYFSDETIRRIAGQFQTLLISAITNPDKKISQLEILSDNDRQQLLVEFNQTQIDYPTDKCIHELFEEQVEKAPNNIAVVFEDQQLTYAELNCKANQLAHYLQTLGVKPEVVVGLCVERSLEMIIGLLGILKAGGAYLPLEPALPKEGLAFRLQDAQVSLLLTQQQLVDDLPTNAAQVICLDNDWDAIAQHKDGNPTSETTVENLVYVLYTSGSTGKPKGVAIEHRQILNYINAILDKLDLPPSASFATVSSFAADLGNTAIFPALCTGGCLHIISQERATNPEALADYCEIHPIDCLKIVPSHLNALLSASHPQKILPRKRLILGGDALNGKLVARLQQYIPDCQILNHYGPTEATVGVLTYPIKVELITNQSETVSLGRPLANTQVYILDNYLQPVPIGVAGELHIGGESLARGYINHPELTSERFVCNPFSTKMGSKLYKTGDLVRYLPDGNIEFLGRVDHQVKIRGFRIELGEIELVLRQNPAIREAVVLAQEDESGNKRLIAYVVPNQQREFLNSDLRNFVKQKLPEYMMPSAFVQLPKLPLTPNGKVDRQALPDPDSVRPELQETFVAPRNPVEETIAKIWAEVLEIEHVGIHDNFFELGGDSIMIIQIAARANQAGLQVTPKQMFEYSTVASLGTVVGITQTEWELVTGSLPLTPTQYWFFEQQLPQPHNCHHAFMLEVRNAIAQGAVASPIAPAILEQAVRHLLEHHDALRLRFTLKESSWQQVNAGLDAAKPLPFSCIDLSGKSAVEQETALKTTVDELQASLNLTEGQLLRVALLNLGDNQPNCLLLVIHHLVVDSVSWQILLEDFQQACQHLSQKKPVQLPAKTTSFKQWSEFLREYAQSSQLLQEREYWARLSHHSICLPVDNREGANTITSSCKVLVSLNVEETRALIQEVPKAYRTQTNEVLVTALVQSFTQWTGGQSLLVDLEGQGREANVNKMHLSRTVGCFTTIFPVLLTLEGISQPGEALKGIKEQLRGVPNQGIGYGVLRYLSEDSSVTAQLQTLPQAEVRFQFLDHFNSVVSESSLFKLVNQTVGADLNSQGNWRYLLDINSFVLEEQLQLELYYSEHIHQQATIEQLAQGFIEALRSLIVHCQTTTAGGYTPSDFPKANLNQKDLDKFLAKINKIS